MVKLTNFLKSAFVAVLLLTSLITYGQKIQVEIEFSQYQTDYTPLETADTLTGISNSWGGNSWVFELDSAIRYSGMEEFPFQTMGIGTYGQIALWNQFTAEPYQLDLYMIPFQSNVIAPGRDHQNDDFGAILYRDEGDHQIIEFRNVALSLENIIAEGRLRSRINYMIEIDPINNSLRFIYGPSTIHQLTEQYFLDQEIRTGIFLEVWKNIQGAGNYELVENLFNLLEGSPENPSIVEGSDIENAFPDNGLNAFPPDGTVYEFQFSPISSTAESTQPETEIKVFPNPGLNRLYLQNNQSGWTDAATVTVYNTNGLLLYQDHPGNSGGINTKTWPAGLYMIRVMDKDLKWNGVWVKQ